MMMPPNSNPAQDVETATDGPAPHPEPTASDSSRTDPAQSNATSLEPGDEAQVVSKSALKREAERITLLGKSISELGEPDIRRLPLDERVLDAVLTLRSITTRGARKRQMLFLGKLLRKSNLSEIENGLVQLQQAAKVATQQFHSVENWRDRLLDDGADALSDFVRAYPACDRQRLRQLIRNTRREREMNKPPKSARELFKLLRDSMT